MKKYDFALAWNDRTEEKFVAWVKEECTLRNMHFLLITSQNVSQVVEDLERSELSIRFLLDNQADYFTPDDLFARLCYTVKDNNSTVVCDPDHAKNASNKAISHFDLLNAKIPVPYTVVVRNWMPDDFRLTEEELKGLGRPFVIKPATGFGQRGVVKDANGPITEIARARQFNRGDSFLLQEKVEPISFDGKQGWFRVYFLFGEIIPCWWNTETGWYGHVSLREMYTYALLPLARITSEIARIANMDFFSTEIAVTPKVSRFIVVDYVNDQPDLCILSEKNTGPVPDVVKHIAERAVETAWKTQRGIPVDRHRSIWLSKAHVEDQSI